MKRLVLLIALLFLVSSYRSEAEVPSCGYFAAGELAKAQREAASKNLPLMWIMVLDEDLNPDDHDPAPIYVRSVLTYVTEHLQDRAVPIVIDGEMEMRSVVPRGVRDAAFSGTIAVPRIAITTADAQVVLASITEERIQKEGKETISSALQKVEAEAQSQIVAGADNYNAENPTPFWAWVTNTDDADISHWSRRSIKALIIVSLVLVGGVFRITWWLARPYFVPPRKCGPRRIYR